jgi:hypothetical protein
MSLASPELLIRWEWEPAESAGAPELASTWARIEIQVGAEFVSLVEDRESGSSRRSIYCPLYPLAEWIVYNWWSLQADARPARQFDFQLVSTFASTKVRRSLWRHSVRASGDGFLWPDLVIIPEGEQSRLAWRSDSASSLRPVRFLTRGNVLTDRSATMEQLRRVVLGVLTRLDERGIIDTPLQAEWNEVQNSSKSEISYCLASARLGLDPYSEADAYEGAILRAAETFSGSLLDDFLDGADAASIFSDIAWISAAQDTIAKNKEVRQRKALRALRSNLQSNSAESDVDYMTSLPWRSGWRQARMTRMALGLDNSQPFNLGDLVVSKVRNVSDPGLLAVGVGSSHSEPVVVTARSGASTQRFTLARALWHQLWDSQPLFLVTGAYAGAQKVERAFAAELLAPANGISDFLPGDPEDVSPENIEELARKFKVSPMVVEHQIQNQLLDASF